MHEVPRRTDLFRRRIAQAESAMKNLTSIPPFDPVDLSYFDEADQGLKSALTHSRKAQQAKKGMQLIDIDETLTTLPP